MAARIEQQPAFVLRRLAYRESSLLLEVFTAAGGRVGLVARGARSVRSRWRGLLQPFSPLLLSWREYGELGSLSAAEAVAPPLPLRERQIFVGWYMNELLLKLLQRHDPHPELFPIYQATLACLLDERELEPALRRFELRLLAAVGYGLPLPEGLDPGARYHFDPQRGATPAPPGAPDSVAGSSLLALRAERFDSPQALRDARRILRAAIAVQLGDRELESRKLLRALGQR